MKNRTESAEHRISKWQIVDSVVIALLLFGSLFFLIYKYYQIMAAAGACVLLLLFFMRSLYDKNIERSRLFKRITVLLRSIGYTAVVIAIIIPFTLSYNWKWYYPVQKMVYGTNETADNFLPDKIPDNAENYNVFFCRAVFPGATRIEISFFTDSETIEKYRNKAIRNGASCNSKAASAGRWYSEMESQNVPYENAEYYFYPNSSEHFPMVYILEESTGYVKIYF